MDLIIKRFGVEKVKILRGPSNHKRLIISPIVKRFGVKNGIYTEGSSQKATKRRGRC
jgi:hypothetical protein